MDLKNYVRKGILDESPAYKTVLKFDGRPGQILLLLEGRARRKTLLGNGRKLYENFYPVSLVGLEDLMLESSRPGAVGVYPGSHYVLWDSNDFLNAISIHPEVARRAIMELSRRIRIYDSHQRTMDLELKQDHHAELNQLSGEMSDMLYEMSFSDDESFPASVIEKLGRSFEPGQYLMKQGDESKELYILLDGEADVFRAGNEGRRQLDGLGANDMAGEMAQFDGMPRSADVIARTQVQALVFNPENFHMIFQLHPKWSRRLLITLAKRADHRKMEFESLDLNLLSQQTF